MYRHFWISKRLLLARFWRSLTCLIELGYLSVMAHWSLILSMERTLVHEELLLLISSLHVLCFQFHIQMPFIIFSVLLRPELLILWLDRNLSLESLLLRLFQALKSWLHRWTLLILVKVLLWTLSLYLILLLALITFVGVDLWLLLLTNTTMCPISMLLCL